MILWDAETGRELLVYTGHKGDAVRAVAFSPDGKKIASAADKDIRLWNPDDGKDIRTFAGPQGLHQQHRLQPGRPIPRLGRQ